MTHQSTEKPLVSVIITTHNRCQLLSRAVDSVLQQTYSPLEIIVVDDGSNDNTQTLLHNYQTQFPNQIRVLQNPVAKGACYARNRGIEMAQGVFVTGLDDDDEFTKDRVSTLIAAYHDQWAFISAGIVERHPDADFAVHKIDRTLTLDACLYANIIGNQVFTRRERLLEVGGFDEKLRAFQDYDMWLRLIEKYGNAKHISDLLYIQYHHHGGNQISFSSNRMKGHLQFLKKHRKKMHNAHLKSHAIESLRIQGKAMSVKQFLQYSSKSTFQPALRYFLKSNFSMIFRLKKRLLGQKKH